VRLTIDMTDYSTAQTRVKAIHENCQPISRETETALPRSK
jgi:hypothetical protein